MSRGYVSDTYLNSNLFAEDASKVSWTVALEIESPWEPAVEATVEAHHLQVACLSDVCQMHIS